MNPFLEACGATDSLQLSVECQGAHRPECVTFDLPFVLIGRDSRADLHFSHPDVSERHVYVQMVAGHLCYVDLGSRMGTFLGGKSLRSGWLPRGESLRVGPYRVRLVVGDSDEGNSTERLVGASRGLAPPPLPDTSPPSLALEINHRGIRPALCPIRGDLTLIGSAADCDVRVLDPSIANFHCSLLHTPSGVWVVDLLGPGGVTVNGAVVRHARLDDGDALRIGHSLIRLRVEPIRAVTVCAFTVPAGLRGGPEPGTEPALALETLGLPALDKDELIEALLSPLSERLDLMQQQMFEQLQQVGVMMIERFAATQEEQFRALQDELEQFRQLTRELDALRSDLATQSERSPSPMPTRLGRATAAPVRPLSANGAIVLARPELNGNGNGNGNGKHQPEPQPYPAAEELVIRLSSVPAQEREQNQPPAVVSQAADPLATGPERRQDVDIQTWLCQRIATIQNQQESRWQKLLRMLPGQLVGKPTI